MSELLLNAKYWRDRAEEARSMALELDDKAAQQTMYEVARCYDRLAERAGALAKTNKKTPARSE